MNSKAIGFFDVGIQIVVPGLLVYGVYTEQTVMVEVLLNLILAATVIFGGLVALIMALAAFIRTNGVDISKDWQRIGLNVGKPRQLLTLVVYLCALSYAGAMEHAVYFAVIFFALYIVNYFHTKAEN